MMHDLEHDQILINRTDALGVQHRARLHRGEYVLRASTADNDINTLYRASDRYSIGYNDPRQYTGPVFLPKFPRSEERLDQIMIRRVHAREQLARERAEREAQAKREKHLRHMKIAGITVLACWIFPLLCAIFVRTWNFAMAWIAS